MPPLQQILVGWPAVVSIVGEKVFMGIAPQGTEPPYLAWEYVFSSPDNNLSDLPESDDSRMQVKAFSSNQSQARLLAYAARDAVEQHTHIVSGPQYLEFEEDTRLHSWILEPYFIINR